MNSLASGHTPARISRGSFAGQIDLQSGPGRADPDVDALVQPPRIAAIRPGLRRGADQREPRMKQNAGMPWLTNRANKPSHLSSGSDARSAVVHLILAC